MGRPLRAAEGGVVYHVLNRANGRAAFCETGDDYQAFCGVLAEAVTRTQTRLLTYCVMPNHWHLVVWPRTDGELSDFAGWLGLTHAQRWHAHHHTKGRGHLYQGRFKSFPVEADDHFLTVCRYVERNPVRAGLVARAEHWLWSSLFHWERSVQLADRPELAAWPVKRPVAWLDFVNAAQTTMEEEALHRSVRRGQPFGSSTWQQRIATRLGLESTFRAQGRPPKKRTGS